MRLWNVTLSWEKMYLWNVTKLWEFKKDFRNVNHGWDFIMDGQKNTHLDFQCVNEELSLEHTPVSVLLTNCLQSKIPFSALRMNCLQSKIPFSALRMNCLQSKIPFSALRMNCLQSKIPFSALLTNCYRRFSAKQSTILTAEYSPCSPWLIDPPLSITAQVWQVCANQSEVLPSGPNQL